MSAKAASSVAGTREPTKLTGLTGVTARKVDFYTPVYCTPVVANNTLFVTTHTHIFAIGK